MTTENEVLRAQVAMLRDTLSVLRAEQMEPDAWGIRCIDDHNAIISEALDATESDATAWLDRQRKLAAAGALTGRSEDFRTMAHTPRTASSTLTGEQIATAVFLACAVNCEECAAQLRKEAGA